ncbi:MAG: acyl-CoA thioesterase [Endozoicomonas sp.]
MSGTIKPEDCERSNYRYFTSSATRWDDNDQYGHMNNSRYYTYFDDTIGKFQMFECGLDLLKEPVVAYVAHSQCSYLDSVSYPEHIDIGLRVNRIGNSSVEYGLAMFRKDEDQAVATSTFTHVFVNKSTGKSAPIPDTIRSAMKALSV